MAIHSKREVGSLLRRLTERYEALLTVIEGKETEKLTATGIVPGVSVKAEDIRFAADDVATALKEIKARLGKG
ncbi:hypothetical protein HFV04_017030 [Pseudomonas sp. BIGb0427]|uniref:hypothetical protein n=1 Tax=Pseudomonas sp. BIGb0427 TaxID=2724470 RepID=UPI0016ADB977|nr:hypothetical protein [Pseudomonas sp. BIGb0427]NLU60047.1 hypothetical protein [Pseudomonas sp. BIGb0427]QPG61223.1 hypothetical protein HFV04_017030 [Pseudomonas sp. BIGb0427]